jgi:sensor histidine kinase YesM
MQVEEYQAAEIKVVPMLLQPIVENAIWHGLQPLSSERILTLSCENNGQEGKFVIEDNGIGIKRSLQSKTDLSKTSVGMENIRERIRLFNQKYHLNYRMEIMDKSDLDPAQSGTRVSIYFNLINNYD